MWLPVTKRWSKARDIALDADCCSGTIKCRSRGINSQSHFVHRFVPSRHAIIVIIYNAEDLGTIITAIVKIPKIL